MMWWKAASASRCLHNSAAVPQLSCLCCCVCSVATTLQYGHIGHTAGSLCGRSHGQIYGIWPQATYTMDAAGAVTTKWRVDATDALPAPLANPDLIKCAVFCGSSSSIHPVLASVLLQLGCCGRLPSHPLACWCVPHITHTTESAARCNSWRFTITCIRHRCQVPRAGGVALHDAAGAGRAAVAWPRAARVPLGPQVGRAAAAAPRGCHRGAARAVHCTRCACCLKGAERTLPH